MNEWLKFLLTIGIGVVMMCVAKSISHSWDCGFFTGVLYSIVCDATRGR